jgi:tetratricopeptide (TPR) repeat protein
MTPEKGMDHEFTAGQAMKAYQQRKYLEADRLFGLAAEGFLNNNDPLKAAEMKNNQSVALLQAGKASESLQAAKGTDLIFAQADDKKRQAMALANMGAAFAELGQKKEAVKVYQESSTIFKELGESDLRADVMRSLSILKIKQGEFTDAVMEMQDGLVDVKKPTLKQRILKKLLFTRLWK